MGDYLLITPILTWIKWYSIRALILLVDLVNLVDSLAPKKRYKSFEMGLAQDAPWSPFDHVKLHKPNKKSY
jgi:hypothetical protein